MLGVFGEGIERSHHGEVLSAALPGNIESCAVIDAGSEYGESQSRGDCAFKVVGFSGDVALVVVEGDDGVVVSAGGLCEDGVSADGIRDGAAM